MKNTVNIHGKEYETVASRVQRFRETYKQDYGIITEIVSVDDERVVMKASIGIGTDVIATGYAEERRDASSINKTSALENCETSAIGRALAAFGMAGTEYATADEVAQAISQHPSKPSVGTSKPADPVATPVQKSQIKAFLQGKGVKTEDMPDYLEQHFGIVPGTTMLAVDAASIIEDLKG